MAKYKGLYTFDVEAHKYVPIAQAKEIIMEGEQWAN